MLIGPLGYGNIFHSQNYLGTENTLADGEEVYFLTSVFYEGTTYVIFTLFLVIMSVLIINLLVGPQNSLRIFVVISSGNCSHVITQYVLCIFLFRQ